MTPAPDSDDERTVGIERPAPDAHPPAVQMGHVLAPGTLVRDYEISALIGEGGFGIVYLAYDHSLQRAVAMKEYMPSSMASRVAGTSEVRVKSKRHEETFRAGLKSFVNEARLLARFDHPALVKVYRFWEENGTAYMVMPYYEGPTLKSALATRGSRPDEAQLRSWLKPLLDALGVMHAAHCFHRDIAPDNILLTPTGPLLLDFGAARRVIGDMTHDLTVVLKPGFAPIEQYGDVATMAQGAWTDLYALACVVYFAITGRVPMSSVERLMDDRLEPLSVLAAGRYSTHFLATIDAALAVRPNDRPQSDAEFRALLDAASPMAAGSSADVALDFAAVEATTAVWHGADSASGAALAPQPADEATQPHERSPAGDVARDAARGSPVPADSSEIEAASGAATSAAVPGRSTRRLAILGGVAAGIVALVAFTLLGRSGPETPSDAAAGASKTTAPLPSATTSTTPTAVPSATTSTTPTATPSATPSPATAGTTSTSAAASSAAMSSPPATATAPATTPSFPPVPAAAPSREPTAVAPSGLPPRVARHEPPPVDTAATALPHREAASRAPRSTAAALEKPALEKPAVETPPVINPKERAARRSADASQCSDILQKASLEPLTADEAAYLKRECR